MKAKLFTLVIFLSFSIAVLYSAPVSWVGPAAGNWSTPENWSSTALPTAADSVYIPVNTIVSITSNVGTVNKLAVAGKVLIENAGTLIVDQTANTVASSPIVNLFGGEIENNGSFTVKNSLSTAANTCIRFSQSTRNNGLINNGTFTLDNTIGTYASLTGRAIGLSQATGAGVSTLKLGGTVNLNIKPGAIFIESNEGGNLTIDGTNVIGSASDYKNFRFARIVVGAGVGGRITIAQTADLTLYMGFESASNGVINLQGSSPTSVCSFTNLGKLKIYGGAATLGYGIYFNPLNQNALNNFVNDGELIVSGNFPAGNTFVGGTASGVSNITNNGTFSLSIGDPAIQLIRTAGTSNKLTLVNNGTLNLSQTANIEFSSTLAVFTNNGTVNYNATTSNKFLQNVAEMYVQNDKIIVNLNGAVNATAEIINLQAKVLKTVKINSINNVIDINQLKGLHIVRLTIGEETMSKKIVL